MKLNILFILIVLILIGAQAKKAKKWRPPLEYGPKTTGIYSSLQRSNRRKINVNLLDPYDDRTKPPRAKLSGTSYKPGTWNWYPNMDIPGYSYRFKIFNLTKDQAGSYMGMHDYRKDYGPLYNTRFGGTYPPIPPLLGDARQPRLAWFLKKYSAPAPPANYIDHVMETIKDGHLRDREFEKQLDAKNTKKVSAEWYTVRPKNESNYFYEEEKIKPRFGDYGGIGLEEAFPAYKPKKPYEVVMLPVQPVYKRSAEASSDGEDNAEKEVVEDEKPMQNLGPKKIPKKSESYSSNSYTYEQFNSNESIPVPFSPEQQISGSSSGDESEEEPEEHLPHPTEPVRHKREVESSEQMEYTSGQKFSDYSEVPDPYSKSASFPSPLNTGESGWGAKPPTSKSTESGSDDSSGISKLKVSKSSVESKEYKKPSQKKKKTKKRKTTNIPKHSGYPDHPYPRMKVENDSEVQRDSSGLDNESFPSVIGSHSSEMLIWDALRNMSNEIKPISSSSSLESSGDLSQFDSEASLESSKSLNSKEDTKAKKTSDEKKGSKNAKKKSVKGKTNKKKVKAMGMPPKHPSGKLKLLDKSDEYSGTDSDSRLTNPFGDLSYVDEVTVGPAHLRTFPPTFTEQYVAPLHHQPDEFWDEIYEPDGPDPTLAPYQIEEEERRKARKTTTTWKPPIITTRDPTSKPRYIYVTNEDTNDEDDIILTSSQQSDKSKSHKDEKKKHSLGIGLTKTQLQLRQILKLKNKRAKNGKGVLEAAKGKDKGKKEKKKPKQKDKKKKENPNNFSRPNPDHIKVQQHSENQAAIGDPLHNAQKENVQQHSENQAAIGDPLHNAQKGNVIRNSVNNIQKGNVKIEAPTHHLNDPQLYLAVTPFEPDYSFSESRPEGNYEWPSLRHPKFNPETAYDEEGYPVHESPDWTSPSTHKKDRIFGRERNAPSGVRGKGISMQQYMKKMNIYPYNAASHPAVASNINTGLHKAGSDKKDSHMTGLDMKGPHKPATGMTGLHMPGPHISELEIKGSHMTGMNRKDPHMTGPHMAAPGLGMTGSDMKEPHVAGLDKKEPHMTGLDMKGPHMPVPDMTGLEMKGSHIAGMEPKESHVAGPHMTAQAMTGSHIMGPHVPVPDMSAPHMQGPHMLGPHMAGLDMQEPHLIGPHLQTPDMSASHMTGPHMIGPDGAQAMHEKLNQVDLTHQAVNNFQLRDVNLAGNADHNSDIVNFHAGMENINAGRARAKRSPKKKDEGLNPLLYGNQNLFSVNHDLTKQQKKGEEGLNPLLYGNQNLFSANHQNYIKLSDIHSPFAKPPYGIPIDSEIKVYNEGHEAPSPVFAENLNEQLTRQRIYLEKMNLLKILQEKRSRLRQATNLRAAARLTAPDPRRHNPYFNKQGMNTGRHPEGEHGIDARHVPDYDHVIHKRDTWDQERLHPMLYGQHGIFKPKHRSANPPVVNKEIEWMPYIDMEAARIFTSNPKLARKRLKEYNKLTGRDTEKLREAMRLRNEKRKQRERNPLMIPNKNHNRDYRKALLRHGIVPGKDYVFAEKNTEIPIKINPEDGTEDRAWMPYINMNRAMAKAMKKTQGEHRIQKRNIEDPDKKPDKEEAQQPHAVTSGYRPKRTTNAKKSKTDSKAKTSVEDMFASYFDHIPQQIITRRPTSTTPAPFTLSPDDSSDTKRTKKKVSKVRYEGGFKDILKGMKQRKKKLQKIQRNTSLLKKLTQSFRAGMDKDMNNTAKKAKFTFTDSLQEEMINKIEARLGKGKPNIDTVAQLKKDIYERIGQRYKQNKSIGRVVNGTHSKVIGGGQPKSYVPHATVRIRLDKKTGQYEMNIWAPKTETRAERVGKVNGTVKVDKRLKDRLKEKIQSHTRNFLVKPSERGTKQAAESENKLEQPTTFQTIKPSTNSFALSNSEESGKTYATIQPVRENFSATQRSIDRKISLKPSRSKPRKVGRPTINKLNRITRAKRSSRKGRPTGSRTRKSRSGSVTVRKSKTPITSSTISSVESDLRKSLDRQVQILFNQTRMRQEKGATFSPFRPPDFSVLDAIEKEIGSIAGNWPENKIRKQSTTTPYPPYKNRFVKEHRFTNKFESRPSFLTTQNLDKAIVPTVMSSILNNVSYKKSQIQTTTRRVQTQTVKPTVKRMSEMRFTYLPRVFTFSPITLKPPELTTRKRYVFTPKYIFESNEDSKSDSGMIYLTALPKRKKEKKPKFTTAPKVPRTEVSTLYKIMKDKTTLPPKKLSPVTKWKLKISESRSKSQQDFSTTGRISRYESQKDLQSDFIERLSDKPSYVSTATDKSTYFSKPTVKPTHFYKPTDAYKATDKPTYVYKPIVKPTYVSKSTVEPTYIYKATDKPTYVSKPTHFYKPTVEPTYIYKATDKPTYVSKPTVKPTNFYKPTVEPTYIYKASDKPTYVSKPTVKPTHVYKPTVEPTYIYKATDKPAYVSKPTVEPTYIYKTTDKPTFIYKPTVVPTVQPTYIYKTTYKPTLVYKPTHFYKGTVKPTYVYKAMDEPTSVSKPTYKSAYVVKPTEFFTFKSSQASLQRKKQQHYFSFGTVRGGYKQFDDSWWRMKQRLNRNRVRGPNSRFAQPLHLRGKTFSQQPLRPQNRNQPFRSVRTFLSGIRKASSNSTETVEWDMSTPVPFSQSKIREFYEHNLPIKRRRTIRPYYNIRLHPMNPVDSEEYTTITSTENKQTADGVTHLNISRTVIQNNKFEDVPLKRKPTTVSTEKTDSKTTALKQKYTEHESEPELSTIRYFIKKENKSVYTTTTVGPDSLETASQLFTTDKSKIKTTPSPALKKPKVISVFKPVHKLPTSAAPTILPKQTTLSDSYLKEILTKSATEEPYGTVKIVLESEKTTQLPSWIIADRMPDVVWPTYETPTEPTIKPYTSALTSTSATVALEEITQKSTTVPARTISKLPRFKFVWPTLKEVVPSTATPIWKATKVPTSFPSVKTVGPKIITSSAKITVKSEFETDRKDETSFVDSDITSEGYSKLVWPELSTSMQTIVPTFYTGKFRPNIVWPTFQTPSTFAPVLSTDSETVKSSRDTQTVQLTSTDKFISNVVWPTPQTATMLSRVLQTDTPLFTTEKFSPRAFWPTFQRYRTFRPKRVQRPYKNPRWVVKSRDLSPLHRLHKTAYPKITKSPPSQFEMTGSTNENEKNTVVPTYKTMSVLEVSTEYPQTVSNGFTTETSEVVWPPNEETSTHIIQPFPTIAPTLRPRSEQSVTEMKWPPTQETPTQETPTQETPPQETPTQAELTTKKSEGTIDSAQYPDLDELTDETTTHPPPTRRRKHTKPRPTKWWLDYVYPEEYRKHVKDSSLDEYYSDSDGEEEVTFLPFDYNTTGTPYYSKLRFGGTWGTFRPIYVRPTTPAPPTTTVLTTKPPPTTPKPKIHHIIKKGFKKFLNIFKFGRRNKQNEESE